jgi:hypothetical protein
MNFSYPAYIDRTVISELENAIIEICTTCKTLEEIKTQSASIWSWASKVLAKSNDELRFEIESHEQDESFPDPYLEEKDHLLKLPLLILEKINNF